MKPESTIEVIWLAWAVSWFVAVFWSNRTKKRGSLTEDVAYRVLFVVSVVLLVAPLADRHYLGQVPLWYVFAALKWILVALTAAGFLFAWWARIHLGRLWSASVTLKAGHRVVDTGPYRLVRHPIYSGIIFAGFASAAEQGTVLAILGAAILTVSFYAKARGEEHFLRNELGKDAYDPYARKTPMLLPFTRVPPN